MDLSVSNHRSRTQHYEPGRRSWNAVSGDVFGVEEIAALHRVRSTRARWLLALPRRRGPRLRCRAAVVDPEQPLRDGARPARGSPPGRRRADLRGVCPSTPAQRGVDSLWGRVREDDAEAREFRPQPWLPRGRPASTRSCWTWPHGGRRASPPDGIELVSLAERPDLEQAVYDVDCGGSAADVPGTRADDFEAASPSSAGSEHYLEGPGAMPDALIVAIADDEVVGYTGLRRRGASSPIAENVLTAVASALAPARNRNRAEARADRPCARGRHRADLHDERRRRTSGMRGVNARLGYRPAPIQILVSGPLA